MHTHSPSQSLLLSRVPAAAAIALLLVFLSPASRAQDDPPMQAGRLSYVSGTVSIQPVGLDDWGAAGVNLPVGPGDRVFTDSDGRAEIQVGRTFLRIGPNTDVSMVDDSESGISLAVAQGSVHLHTLGLWSGQSISINTPSGSAILSQPGELRIDVYPDQQAAIFTSLGEYAQITGAGGFSMDLYQGQALELLGSNPVTPQWLAPAPPDDLDIWSRQRDQHIAMAGSWRYISPEMPGGDELDANGSWSPGTPYGPIWYPNVDYGWTPYHYGHWVNHWPWGPVWVEDEPWGYAPFHYGRWVMYQDRWGWVPGPIAVHPIWSPALVVFGGGVRIGGAAVSVWFPLGPGEPYHPWYPCSPRYIDQVNITNIAPAPRVRVLSTYVNINIGAFAFVNRTVGVTAIRQDDFAAGRPVRQTNIVVNQTIVQRITVVNRPVVEVNQRTIIERPPARPVPVAVIRPTVINQQGMVVSAKPGFRPVAAPLRQAPPPRTIPGRTVIAPPPNSSAYRPGQPSNAPPSGNMPNNEPRPFNPQPGNQQNNQGRQYGQPSGNPPGNEVRPYNPPANQPNPGTHVEPYNPPAGNTQYNGGRPNNPQPGNPPNNEIRPYNPPSGNAPNNEVRPYNPPSGGTQNNEGRPYNPQPGNAPNNEARPYNPPSGNTPNNGGRPFNQPNNPPPPPSQPPNNPQNWEHTQPAREPAPPAYHAPPSQPENRPAPQPYERPAPPPPPPPPSSHPQPQVNQEHKAPPSPESKPPGNQPNNQHGKPEDKDHKQDH